MILICPTLKPHEAWMKEEEAAKFKTDDKSERKQGYSDRDATHSTGLPAACSEHEGKILAGSRRMENAIHVSYVENIRPLKKECSLSIYCVYFTLALNEFWQEHQHNQVS